ncbi:MAG: DUF11 domain-containing protein [Verrucomicrobiales bacterium]|nr:DUF11 domain-containing protein [Verrucomicrobiales bacterium]
MQPRTLPRRRAGRTSVPGLRAWVAAWLLLTPGTVANASESESPDPPEPDRPPAPVLTLASRRDLGTRVAGQLHAQPETSYQILLWTVTGCGADRPPVDFHPLAEIDAPTDAAGHGAFQLVLPIPLNDTQQIVARTRDATGATSDLSHCRPVEVQMTYWEDAVLTLAGPTNTAVVGEELTCTITLANRSEGPAGPPALTGLEVELDLPDLVDFVRASPGAVVDEGRVRFPDLTLPPDGAEPLRVTLRPQVDGPLTLTARVNDTGPYQANNLASVTVEVAEPPTDRADLALTLTAAPANARVGMALTCTVVVTNQGPDDAGEVIVTNRLPTGVSVLEATATQGRPVVTDELVVCRLGLMTNGSSAQLSLVLQPRVEGELAHVASVFPTAPRPGTPENGTPPRLKDPNLENNVATNLVLVAEARPLEPMGSPAFDAQRGWFEQTVRFTHGGRTRLPGVRLWLEGLAADTLVLNRSGTENGRPYLHLGRAVAAGETVEFIVELYRPDRQPVPTPLYEAAGHAGGGADVSPDPGRPPLVVKATLEQPGLRLDWNPLPSRRYLVQSRVSISDCWRTSAPSLTTTSDHLSWRDRVAMANPAPTPSSRFYRVLELP